MLKLNCKKSAAMWLTLVLVLMMGQNNPGTNVRDLNEHIAYATWRRSIRIACISMTGSDQAITLIPDHDDAVTMTMKKAMGQMALLITKKIAEALHDEISEYLVT